ncbi:unnamed protein product [Lactuca saligna]|uniref:Uncharacterized protein n=1 Tax=Lactuca saligna TaxID=75948 RepID=A0AA36E072_LACSI|nr:unnamed protein product [Lactuca saligna]
MKIPSFGERPIPLALHDVLDVGDAPKRVRLKRKSKVDAEELDDYTISVVNVTEDIASGNNVATITKNQKHTPKLVDQHETLKATNTTSCSKPSLNINSDHHYLHPHYYYSYPNHITNS